MAIRVALNHVTTYRYDRPVELAPHVVRLRPAPHCRTAITAYSLEVSPAEHFLNWQQDPFGNYQARLVFPRPARELRLEVDLVAELTSINPFDFFLEEYAEKVPWPYEASLRHDLTPYLSFAPGGPRFDAFTERARGELVRPGRRTIDVLVDLNRAVHKALRYDIRMEPGVFTPEETLTRGHGSCRDFAWLLAQLCRRLGYAARFVSGYSIQLVADQKPLEGPAGVSADVTDLHAWAEIFLPGAGWIGFDATSGLACGEGHIPLSCTPDPGSAAPVTGSYGWSKRGPDDKVEETFAHSMSVTRIEDLPRATKPYDEASWRAILACGDRVEAELERNDVRLTMGGEPTFVSVDDMDAPEWTTAAFGPTKAGIADQLLRKLARRFAPGALLHHGQGKWYPGEPLPRWAYSCYFRHDGQPIWQDPALYADGPGTTPATPDAAAAFGQALARRLAVDPAFLQAAHEDVFYYLWRERQLPVNVDPFESKLDDEQERARLRRIFEQGLDRTVGFALPLRAVVAGGDGGHRFESGPWFLRGERLYLLPGDSPMGFRLPLDSLPWVAPQDREAREAAYEQDPFAPRPPLPPRAELGRSRPRPQGPGPGAGGQAPPARGESAASLTRTALCIEPRGGMLHMFMPPMPELEPYLALVAAIEETAQELHQPVRLEGYHPPQDPRLNRLQVTPDPGVIEVNIHPARSWRDLVSNTTALYEEARSCRLGTEKFMVDGRHTGTGGGNHVVLGGARPGDSPLLRRPDMLRSLAGYWLNHPSLSYLFSGLFIGPTSQAPRVDEARHDALYELDIAFRQLHDRAAVAAGGPTAPWLVDRLFRNLFVDVTGNTHRTEFCVDKLYSPDSASGRQGLLELRAFEMPPDARMSCAQQLLVRSLLAWFWREPYTRPLVRWGTSLNDRFMLPHYVKQDFGDVIEDLGRAGLPLDAAWFEPHYQFRFPLHGRAQVRDVEIELRHALEPWHVMGEETTGTGTARFVDSSVERVQVLVRGVTDGRHVIACNGRRVPLGGTGTREEMVAGVRYRAWQPPSALHPTIGVHSPLVFDVIDTWAGRSVGGCSYHVTHPGGRSYDNFPSNALEAESRRQSRFFPFGHTPGPMEEPRAEPNPELPHTLDLRRTVHK